jgi:hypothetical protein
MPLRPPRQPPKDAAEWDRWARDVPVTPDPDSVGNTQLKADAVATNNVQDSAITTPKILDENVTDPKLADMPALSAKTRASNTDGVPGNTLFSSDNTFLVRRGTQIVADPLVESDIPASIARDAEVTAAIAAHEAAPDPHPQYTTSAEVAAAITAHEALSDPHPGYLTPAEADVAYQPITLSLTNAVDDAAAATAGVAVGRLYRNGSVVMIRVT